MYSGEWKVLQYFENLFALFFRLQTPRQKKQQNI